MNLSPANKNLFTKSFILYLYNKGGPNKGIRLKRVFIPKLLNNPLASCSLINLDFLLLQTVQFGISIILPFFVFYNFWVSTICIFLLLFYNIVL